jgi:hypothetical protein
MDGHLVDGGSPAWKAYYDIEDFKEKGLALIDQWGIQAVYHPVLTVPDGNIHWLAHKLAYDTKWRLAGADQYGLLFLRTKGDNIDERTQNLLRIAYWRRVLVESTFNAITAGRNSQRARNIAEYAQRKIEALQSGKP